MMKILTNLSLALLLVLSLGGSASAQPTGRDVVCEAQGSRVQAIQGKFFERMSAYDDAVSFQSEARESRLRRQEERLEKIRLDADELRQKSGELLRDKQTSDSSKETADDFMAEVESAVDVRRQSYDKARSDYRLAVDKLLANRDQAMRSAMEEFKGGVNQKLDEVTDFCKGSGQDLAAVRQDLKQGLQSARINYGDKLRARQDFRIAVRDAADVRNDAYRAATSQFQKSMQEIRARYPSLNGAN